MKMAKLTLAPNGPALHVNPDYVMTAEPTGNSGTWTDLRLVENRTYTIAEPVEQVVKILSEAK